MYSLRGVFTGRLLMRTIGLVECDGAELECLMVSIDPRLPLGRILPQIGHVGGAGSGHIREMSELQSSGDGIV